MVVPIFSAKNNDFKKEKLPKRLADEKMRENILGKKVSEKVAISA